MSSRTSRSSGRGAKQPEPEGSYPHIPEPKQSHAGNLLAFVSVLAVLGFGFWTAVGTLTGSEEKVAPLKPVATTEAAAAGTSAPAGGASPTAAVAAAPTATSAAALTPTATPGGARVHVVKQGDTLYAMAREYRTTVEAIMQANGITDRGKILNVGDRITIP